MEHLAVALQITLVGMGLVFAAIILLWGLMTLLMRVTAVSAEAESAAATGLAEAERQRELELKQRAAAIAVSVALAQQQHETEVHPFPLPPTAIVSAWQAVMRADQLRRKEG